MPLQLDIIKADDAYVEGNMYTGDRCVRFAISRADYEALIRDGFFIRNGQTPDSAGVLNTTKEYATNAPKKMVY